MTGRVPEVNTLPAAIPPHSTFDRYAAFLKAELPYAQRLGGDGEGKVHRALPIVRWDPTVRRVHPRDCSAPPEEEQDGRLPGLQRYQARTGIEYTKAKDISIKSDGRVEIVYVESGL